MGHRDRPLLAGIPDPAPAPETGLEVVEHHRSPQENDHADHADTARAPNPIDIAVGAKVAELRKFRGQTQSDLGAALGLTFQQIQKYETGRNRISCSKLVGIAKALGVSPAYFFTADSEEPEPVAPIIMSSRLIRAVSAMPAKYMGTLADVAEAFAEHRA